MACDTIIDELTSDDLYYMALEAHYGLPASQPSPDELEQMFNDIDNHIYPGSENHE